MSKLEQLRQRLASRKETAHLARLSPAKLRWVAATDPYVLPEDRMAIEHLRSYEWSEDEDNNGILDWYKVVAEVRGKKV